jgi:hypothetical protein
MKTFIITLLFLGLTISSYSQEKYRQLQEEGVMKVEDLLRSKSAGDDFSIYLPDEYRSESKSLRIVSSYDLGKTSKVTKHT